MVIKYDSQTEPNLACKVPFQTASAMTVVASYWCVKCFMCSPKKDNSPSITGNALWNIVSLALLLRFVLELVCQIPVLRHGDVMLPGRSEGKF